jgi:hypothetical protein
MSAARLALDTIRRDLTSGYWAVPQRKAAVASPSTPDTGRVRELEPANSRDLIDRLPPHARRFT